MERPLVKQSFFQRIFKQLPKENAVIALNNLLAIMPLKDIEINHISEIEKKYKVNLLKSYYLNLEEFYAVVLNYFLKDKILSQEEAESLKKLKEILGLSDTSISYLHEQIGAMIYKELFEEVVSDGKITLQESRFLEDLENKLKLPNSITKKISEEVRTKYMKDYIAQILANQKFSPNDEREMQSLARNLNLNIQLENSTLQQLEKLKHYWVLENLDLPHFDVEISLQKGEKCYFTTKNVNWYEVKKPRNVVQLTTYSVNLKFIKNLFLNKNLKVVHSKGLKVLNVGNLYLTDKRIIFDGIEKKSTITFDKIMNIIPYTDGVEIDKIIGNDVILQINESADTFCIILDQLIKK